MYRAIKLLGPLVSSIHVYNRGEWHNHAWPFPHVSFQWRRCVQRSPNTDLAKPTR
jgi:hypothetical protein